jgi:hypothetical protein
MGIRSFDRATDCRDQAMDWSTLGRRIRHTASMATAVHLAEGAAMAADVDVVDWDVFVGSVRRGFAEGRSAQRDK